MRQYPHLAIDFYKSGHIFQYPRRTEVVYSNFTCRADKHATMLPDYDHKVVVAGLQGVIQSLLIENWNENFFRRPKHEVVGRYIRVMDQALGPNAVPPDHIAALHDLGYLPVLIKALPEGSRVDLRVPLWTIRNTNPEFFWLTNYLETQLSAELWHIMTTATIAYEYRRLLEKYAAETGAPREFVPWQGHDFSFRGLEGIDAATASGSGHLYSFTGTDTVPSIPYLEDYYGAAVDGTTVIGGSVPATEHSVMCMGGEEDELGTYRRLITEIYPAGIVSIVSDTWDFWNVITNLSVTLKPQIMARAGKVVFRPDSGDPIKIICGDQEAPEGSPARKGAVECLYEIFGGTMTSKGYITLDQHIGLIYGDSITLDRAAAILAGLKAKGFSSANIVFGIGSYTYQHVTRDTFGTAIKATYGEIDGEPRAIAKNPKTDDGTKKSACGLLRVEYDGATKRYILLDEQSQYDETGGLLHPVFRDGRLMNFQTLSQIRERLWPANDNSNALKEAA